MSPAHVDAGLITGSESLRRSGKGHRHSGREDRADRRLVSTGQRNLMNGIPGRCGRSASPFDQQLLDRGGLGRADPAMIACVFTPVV